MTRTITAQFQRERLHRAAAAGDLPLVQQLLASRYPVNRFDGLGKTPLHYAVAGDHVAVVDALLRAGANVNANDPRVIGNTPLADGAGVCSYEMARRLIDAGADPTLAGWMQMTALDRAQCGKHLGDPRVRVLLESAAKRHRLLNRNSRKEPPPA